MPDCLTRPLQLLDDWSTAGDQTADEVHDSLR